MRYHITASNTHPCIIQLPASKSISNRALIINALAGSPYPAVNIAQCNDTKVIIDALASNSSVIDIDAAGTAMRFLTAYYSMQEGRNVTITGSQRMLQRPIAPLVDALRQAGAHIDYVDNEGYPPLHIRGKRLLGGHITIPGHISSQFISALLLIAPYMQQGLHLTIEGEILSRPYIDMTIGMMLQFGAKVSANYPTIEVEPSPYIPRPYDVEPDFSALSYWYEIAALNHYIYLIDNLPPKSLQGDARVADYFAHWGIETIFKPQWAAIYPIGKRSRNKTLRLDLKNEPDLAQTIIMTCALSGQHFCIEGLNNLRIKETDRIAAIISEAAKLGYIFTQPHPHCIAWNGRRKPIKRPIVIDTHNDHRMAMAFAPAALRFDEIIIDNPQVVAKSYPHFWEDLQQAGFIITPID